jgi:hypothetical protein
MVFTVEVLLRETDRVVTETVAHDGNEPLAWTDEDVRAVLEGMLLAIDRAKNPDAPPRTIVLRGLSWIVDAMGPGVVIAIEIPSGAAVAGPFEVPRPKLDAMISRVLTGSADTPTIH